MGDIYRRIRNYEQEIVGQIKKRIDLQINKIKA